MHQAGLDRAYRNVERDRHRLTGKPALAPQTPAVETRRGFFIAGQLPASNAQATRMRYPNRVFGPSTA